MDVDWLTSESIACVSPEEPTFVLHELRLGDPTDARVLYAGAAYQVISYVAGTTAGLFFDLRSHEQHLHRVDPGSRSLRPSGAA